MLLDKTAFETIKQLHAAGKGQADMAEILNAQGFTSQAGTPLNKAHVSAFMRKRGIRMKKYAPRGNKRLATAPEVRTNDNQALIDLILKSDVTKAQKVRAIEALL